MRHGLRMTMLALALAGGADGAEAGGDPLAAHLWKARVLVVSAPSPEDGRLRAQRAILAKARAGTGERDLVTLEAVGEGAEATALRRRLNLPADAFRAVLVGKDGGAKLSSAEPIPPERLFATIDAMPMRRDEMRDKGR
ncbi:DUF4174 domain-containing protein [Methylobacterium oxalidis]|uniref:DUF4174 domain-containing protein n=1 Tax=Methylobacterium oxalidis TaxID=944322 RepID=A0A512IY53_9HYPH|nr:DUF4174 domain-containing protein [Methylobacterium oxalidis]GEP02658.1 hypothetical protein MOX02_06960 [Methylobacterium oxalidis]GJE30011.1 hypothetical protein LDDCCGHA_0174 [Methylobacterium oxalidis]GLS61867.1 hypothetical protein GCM10007888_02480 [Methylobacterium oxalidis]